MNIIDELRNDLQLRDAEFEEQRKLMEKLQEQNDYLKRQLRDTGLEKITLESKLRKMITVKELDGNFSIIEQSRFFEHKKSKGT